VEVVHHVDVLEVAGRRFVSHIYKMFERKIPDRESLELRITRVPPRWFSW
jgi:hypothetical protein